jgi:hypothetical protein
MMFLLGMSGELGIRWFATFFQGNTSIKTIPISSVTSKLMCYIVQGSQILSRSCNLF